MADAGADGHGPAGAAGAGSAELFVERSGPLDDTGPLVVLVHGSMDRSSAFAKVVRRLADRGVASVRYDRRGYARSLGAPGPFTVERHTDDLAGIVERFAPPDGRIALVGHSFGGDVALAYAARHPERVGAVAAYESPMSWEPWWPGSSKQAASWRQGDPGTVAENFMRRVVGASTWDRLPAATRAQRRAEGATLIDELASLAERRPYDPTRLTMPVLAAYGEHGAEHHRAAAEVLAGLVGAEVVCFAGAGHNGHSSHPDRFCELVLRVRELSAP